MSDDKKGIAIQAVFAKATTTIGNAWRISFDIDESQSDAVTRVAALRDKVIYLVIMEKLE